MCVIRETKLLEFVVAANRSNEDPIVFSILNQASVATEDRSGFVGLMLAELATLVIEIPQSNKNPWLGGFAGRVSLLGLKFYGN